MSYYQCPIHEQIIVGSTVCPDCDQYRIDRWTEDRFVVSTMENARLRGVLNDGMDMSDIQAGTIVFNYYRDRDTQAEIRQSELEFQFALQHPEGYQRWKEEDNFRKQQDTYQGKELEYFAPESFQEAINVMQFLENLEKNMTPVTDYRTGAEILKEISSERVDSNLSGIDIEKIADAD